MIDLFINSYYYSGIRLKKKDIYESNKVFFNGLQQELIRIRGNSESCNCTICIHSRIILLE